MEAGNSQTIERITLVEAKEFSSGKKLIAVGESVNRMYVVYKGLVEQTYHDTKILLGPGTVVGLSDSLNRTYESEYVCLEDSTLFPCSYSGVDDFYKIFEADPVFIFGFAKGAFRQCRDIFAIYDKSLANVDEFYDFTNNIYKKYKKVCNSLGAPVGDIISGRDFERMQADTFLEKWEKDYIDCLNSIDNKQIENIYGKCIEVVIGVIGICCGYIKRAINVIDITGFYLEEFMDLLIGDRTEGMFDLLFDLKRFAYVRRIDYTDVDSLIKELQAYLTSHDFYDIKLVKARFNELAKHDFKADRDEFEAAAEAEQAFYQDTLAHIAEFAGYSEQKTEAFREAIIKYSKLEDKESKEDDVRKLRKNIVDTFYDIYGHCFFKAVDKFELDPIMTMFLNFGFVDVDVVSPQVADELVELTESMSLMNQDGVYTIFNWLKAVYKGEREPGKNELDLDYRGFVMEERKSGNITESQVPAMLEDKTSKVKFEMENFFKSANRTTSGKMTAFCPVLMADDFSGEVKRMLVTVDRLKRAMVAVEDVDFGIFYREEYYNNMEANVRSEAIMHRVAPDIILLPNVGQRAMMWQECGGIKVSTPARFVFPLFTIDDVDKMMLNCCGAFRWEICRREQGSRWNDIASDCLTSDFYDYITFYRKNKDLNAEQKEKVKSLMKANRNNMREAFSKQYAIWLNFEAKGSVRLNKVEREIFCKHIPFAKKYLSAVAEHPMYQEYISRYNVKKAQKVRHMHMVFDKMAKDGFEITDDIKEGFAFFEL